VNRRDFLAGTAATPLLLGLAPAAFARRFGGTPLALVTADTESRVIAVELGSGRIYRHVPTLPGPRSIESVVGETAVVAHTTEGAVSLVDARSLEVRHVLRGFAEPRYTAASPTGRCAYVSDSKRGEVVVLDVVRGRILRRAEVGGPARHISIDRSGRRLWCSLGPKAKVVVVLDVSDAVRPRLLHSIRPDFLAHDVGFAPGGRHVWMTSGDRGVVAVYDARTRRVLFTLDADAPPQHVTFTDRDAHVTSGEDGTLRVHALRDGRLLRTTRIPKGSYNVQEGFGRVLTPSLDVGTLCVLDGRGALLERVQVAASSHDACFVMSA
jgi:WD40 repeat protein